MSIVYALVSRGNTVMAEYTDSTGNFTTVTQAILDKLPLRDAKCTYNYDTQFQFHYIQEDGLVYLCMAERTFGSRLAFSYLAQIQRDFAPHAGAARTAIAYSFNREFSPVLRRQMAAFAQRGGGGGGDQMLAQARRDIEDVKGVMVQNIEKVLERGEHIDLLVDKAEDLSASASKFNKTAVKLHHAMWWKNRRCCMIGSAVAVVVIVAIALIIWSKTK